MSNRTVYVVKFHQGASRFPFNSKTEMESFVRTLIARGLSYSIETFSVNV